MESGKIIHGLLVDSSLSHFPFFAAESRCEIMKSTRLDLDQQRALLRPEIAFTLSSVIWTQRATRDLHNTKEEKSFWMRFEELCELNREIQKVFNL